MKEANNKNYRLNLYIAGVVDGDLDIVNPAEFRIMKKGEVSNKRTGDVYIENIISKTLCVEYKEGFQTAIDEMLQILLNNPNIVGAANSISLQICVDLDENYRVPYIFLTARQIEELARIGADVEVHIS